MKSILQQWLLMLPGVFVAGYLIDGIQFDQGWKLAVVAAVLSLLNSLVRPVLIFFALPFVVLTLGLGILLINALMLLLAGGLVPGFHVASFGTAFLGSLLISVINFLVAVFFGGDRVKSSGSFRVERRRSPRGHKKVKRDDVIDV